MKKNLPKRMVIYAKDIENLTGRSPQSARRLLQQVRRWYGKKQKGFISIAEFCEYTGLPEAEVSEHLNA
ncbi:hypothetical protein [Chitinophaga japonensis]|uniref:Uncharacterized protein n=1 Tax=Chitinophaga japonensis TaxID=104662 RepID=A0A562SZJ2_CHIJA|nr:hypothetical protein [Chitinophaga japonensis]TWI86672.1 hypothetical protein LX66_3935 [Chitinophaga japonensis]